MKQLIHILCHTIFWIWNLVFLSLIYVGILPHLGLDLANAVVTGEIPTRFIISFAILVILPTACTLIGWFRLRKHPGLLMRLFFGIEAPTVALCLLNLFLFRDLTPASSYLLGTLAFCTVTLGIELLAGYAARRPGLAWVQMVSHSLMPVMGLYVGVLLLFYTVPVGYQLIQLQSVQRPLDNLLYQIGYDLFCYGISCTLFVTMPFVLITMYVQSWWRIFTAFGREQGQRTASLSTAGVAIAWFLLFLVLLQQPQIQAFQKLEQVPETDRDRQELLAQSDSIRDGLLNAYLSSYRYLGTEPESNQLREMYRYVFGLSQAQAQVWQDLHNAWISPFLYQGDRNDAEKAADLYAQFFDAPIQKAEKSAINRAVQATPEGDTMEAGLLDINQHAVWLAQQRVTVQEQGDWAEVELYEQYRNPTWQDQEIFYSFSLPESAVITGVWLGYRDDVNQRFRFTVSPRGSAQQVYKEEVEDRYWSLSRRENSALLEQVGLRQYRLRIFPDRKSEEHPGELHLWMTYQVMQQNGEWALPQITEKRNIFWTDRTIRRRNGQEVKQTFAEDEWMGPAIAAQTTASGRSHQTELLGYRVSAVPVVSSSQVPQGQRIAVVVDSSRSMAAHKKELAQSLNWLTQHAGNNDLDGYLTRSDIGGSERMDDLKQLNPDRITFYGTLHIPDLLNQFEQERNDTAYDAVLLLTDEGSYELAEDEAEIPEMTDPLWVVHLGGTLPSAYDDKTLESLYQSRGGVATTVDEAMQRLTAILAPGESVASVADGYLWTVDQSQTTASTESSSAQRVTLTTEADETAFVPLAARQLILSLSREKDMTQVAELDAIHAIAKQVEIVTPYSSMLVLVNDRQGELHHQRESLRRTEASADRFHREVENGTEALTSTL